MESNEDYSGFLLLASSVYLLINKLGEVLKKQKQLIVYGVQQCVSIGFPFGSVSFM